jgi:hypothetical protein
MPAPKKYPAEVRERAVRLVMEAHEEALADTRVLVNGARQAGKSTPYASKWGAKPICRGPLLAQSCEQPSPGRQSYWGSAEPGFTRS